MLFYSLLQIDFCRQVEQIKSNNAWQKFWGLDVFDYSWSGCCHFQLCNWPCNKSLSYRFVIVFLHVKYNYNFKEYLSFVCNWLLSRFSFAIGFCLISCIYHGAKISLYMQDYQCKFGLNKFNMSENVTNCLQTFAKYLFYKIVML